MDQRRRCFRYPKIKMVMDISGCSKPLAIAQEKDEAIREAINAVLN